MKKFSALVGAAILGSAITVGTTELLSPDKSKIRVETIEKVPAVQTGYATSESGELVPLDFTKAAEKVMPAVVHIRSTQKLSRSNPQVNQIPEPFRDFLQPFGEMRPRGPRQGTGSGVIINKDGYIVTNNHVIEGADVIEVTLQDNRSYKAEVIGVDPTTDLGLIKIREQDLPYLSIVNSDDVKVGEWVLAVGNPFNLNSTVTAGIVSAKGRNIGIIGDSTSIESFIQTDAAVNPGNSGGALTNLNGDLVGINTAIASPTGSYSGYSFAVPSNIVTKVVEDLMTYGVVQRGWLGVTITNINDEVVRDLGLEVNNGALIRGFAPTSGAKEAGIEEGDVIVEVDGRQIKNTAGVIGYIGSKRPGDKVTITVNRDGKEREFEVLLKNREGNTEIVKRSEMNVLDVLGVELNTVDDKVLRRLDIPSGVQVSAINPGKVRRTTDMRPGFIITKIDGEKVNSPKEVEKLLENKSGGILIEGVYEDAPGNYYYALGLD